MIGLQAGNTEVASRHMISRCATKVYLCSETRLRESRFPGDKKRKATTTGLVSIDMLATEGR